MGAGPSDLARLIALALTAVFSTVSTITRRRTSQRACVPTGLPIFGSGSRGGTDGLGWAIESHVPLHADRREL